jgi:hypothetical protein
MASMLRAPLGLMFSLPNLGVAAIALIGATIAPAMATELTVRSGSTLDSQVSPQLNLDATIASMVQRGLIEDLEAQSTSHPAPPQIAAAPLKPAAQSPSYGRTKWRPAGQTARRYSPPIGPVIAPGAPSAPVFPAFPFYAPAPPPQPSPIALNKSSTPMAAAKIAFPEDQIPSQVPSTETAKPVGDDASAPAPADGEDDHLAPIDDLSETPAPDSDAPGDPIEPEYTGEAIPDAQASEAKPLRVASRPSTAPVAPIGEPDRPAKPDLTTTPASPEEFQEAEETPPIKAASLPPLTRNQRALRDKVRRVLQHYYNRPLSTVDRSPWEVMHAMLSFEVHSRVLQANRQPITAVGWLCFNQPCENRSLLFLNEDGEMRVKVGPALQGHHGQLLALLAQARVRSDYPMKVEGKDFTVADLIEIEKATCYPKTELTFKLIGLQRYLDINAKWVNDQGMHWDFPTLVREELRQPVRTAACGGTHRLGGLALAVKKRRAAGLPVDGVYAEADKFVANYRNYALSLQNPDGSFSTEWFKGPGREPDIDRRLKTTGHTLEWLLYAGSDEQLTHYRTVRAVNYLSNIMHANRTRDWEAGPLGHAIHALVLYDRLAFAKYDALEGAPGNPVAHRPQPPQQRRATR